MLIFEKGVVMGAYFSMGAYFPRKSDCKAYGCLFSMGANFWVGAYFPVNTVAQFRLKVAWSGSVTDWEQTCCTESVWSFKCYL